MSDVRGRDPATAVLAIIAETFGVEPTAITRATTADDIDGWDSLGHSVLLTRLARRLGLPIGEDIAGAIENVGQLIDRLADLERRIANAA